jgi:hypothetical protein
VVQAFQLDHMARNVAALPLRDLIAALLMRLLDERVPLLPDGAQLLKALNVLMLKMLDHSNRYVFFWKLWGLLTTTGNKTTSAKTMSVPWHDPATCQCCLHAAGP